MSVSHPNVGDFKWGIKRGVGLKNKEMQFYESFVYEGVEYFLYDCVYFYHTDHTDTSIGKLVKIYERPTHEKMVKVVWFFRPSEIRNFLGDYQPRWNELFLASGVGKGVSNVNFLESIIGKCSVVCTSKDKRNPEPSETELKRADFFFNCTFDVAKRIIVNKFPDEIDGVKVEQFFNRKGDKKTSNHLHVETNIRPKIVIKIRNLPSDILQSQVEDKSEVTTSENVLLKSSSCSFPYKKRKIVEEESTISQSSKSPKDEEFNEKKADCRQDKRVETYRKVIEVNERPNAPWDERLRNAQELGTLVLMNNLDPSYTSYEVEDLVWHALKEKVAARMIEWSPTSNTYYGRALVIFKTKDAAESAISELNNRCLILGEGRIVSAEKGTVREPCKQSNFSGHLVIRRRVLLQKRRQEMSNAISTSHCSQPNTIEYAMAIKWLLEYHKSDACWNALYKRQLKEILDVKSKFKMDGFF
ncbi:protein ANTI-SILENCING 1-like [Gastrolobium bilobum]|uniref:protein ANTI-SILENCING 1-like n=1 Tax=Gastrolobium bilobum TaxID=150636 RepID=UPI002AB0AB06|nr:protein ANTI-SILENCING 1-like [Gastrolobium bilobum]